jgi:uncharacterized protein YndB with AHSA1/START domain
MNDAVTSDYAYVIFIRTTPDALWTALTSAEFTRRYWFGTHQECDWTVGSSWRLAFADGRVGDTGEILRIDPPRHLVIKWRNEFRPELKDEGHSVCTMSLEPVDGSVKLTITHTMARPRSKFIEAVSSGWPRILSNLKSLIETGEPIFGPAM